MHVTDKNLSNNTPSPAKHAPSKRVMVLALTTMLVGITAGFAWSRAPGTHGMGPFARAHAHDYIEYRIDKALDSVDASAEQKLKIHQIMSQLEDDKAGMQSLHEQMQQRMHDIMGAESIDREQLEAIRTDIMQHANAKSLLVTQAIGDAAEVLTADQRRALIQQFAAEHMGD